jgi:hypothetical protein
MRFNVEISPFFSLYLCTSRGDVESTTWPFVGPLNQKFSIDIPIEWTRKRGKSCSIILISFGAAIALMALFRIGRRPLCGISNSDALTPFGLKSFSSTLRPEILAVTFSSVSPMGLCIPRTLQMFSLHCEWAP